MTESGGGPGFAQRVLARGLFNPSVFAHYVQGNVALQNLVVGAINNTPASLPNFRRDSVLAKQFADHRCSLESSRSRCGPCLCASWAFYAPIPWRAFAQFLLYTGQRRRPQT